MTTIPAGTFAFGPTEGQILVKVFKEGMAAKMGHNLVLEVKNWNAKAEIDPSDLAKASIQATAEVPSFSIVEATGGVKDLTRSDRADIKKNIEQKVLNAARFPTITFRSTGVNASGDTKATLSGELSIAGTSRPVDIQLNLEGGKLKGSFTVVQSQWGIKPFSAMMGALKVRDAVDVLLEVALPTT